ERALILKVRTEMLDVLRQHAIPFEPYESNVREPLGRVRKLAKDRWHRVEDRHPRSAESVGKQREAVVLKVERRDGRTVQKRTEQTRNGAAEARILHEAQTVLW